MSKKKVDWPKTGLLVKNSLFLSNQAEIPATLLIHEAVIFTKFYKNRRKNVDFLLINEFWASLLFLSSNLIIMNSGGVAHFKIHLWIYFIA